jgi:biopolymer transport protein ExbB
MQSLRDFLSGFAGLLGASGVLWLLFLLGVLLWALIFERYWYFYLVHPQVLEIAQRRWKRWADSELRVRRRARQQILISVMAQMDRAVKLISSLIVVILLLGLLGSVGGMMAVLDALPVGGAAGEQLVARAIAAAAVPIAVAGAVVVAALFFSRSLRDRSEVEIRLLNDRLRRN